MGNRSTELRPRSVVAALALALVPACPTVDLGDTPADLGLCNPPGGAAYFEATIWPSYIRHGDAQACTRAGGCHEAASDAGAGLLYGRTT